jgi:hypothetical protein
MIQANIALSFLAFCIMLDRGNCKPETKKPYNLVNTYGNIITKVI